MRKHYTLIAFAVMVGVGLAAVLIMLPQAEKPRIVFLICLDAVRPDHLGCYGHSRDTSPNIDALAEAGARFDDAVTQAPWTLPSVATVLSSTFPCQHGARRTEGTQVAYGGLSRNFVQTMVAEGFETALFTGGLTIQAKVPAQELSQAALDWLRQNSEQKCFVVIHHYDTHSPYVAGRECIERLDPGYSGRFMYKFGDLDMLKKARAGRLAEVIDLSEREIEHIKAIYDCQIIRGDESVGMIVDSLRSWELLDESMIVVFADHGEEFLEHGSIDHGQTVYEETIRVPLVIYCPSLIDGPVTVNKQVGLIDLGPTIFDAVGMEKPSYFEGISLMPLVSDAFEASGREKRPCGLPTTCLISESIARRTEKKALRRPPWKLIYDPFFGACELYNLASDPLEKSNLIEAEPEIALRLTDTLLTMQKYYPGGWCIAWRDADRKKVSGVIRTRSALIEAVAHNFYPEIDTMTDTLTVSTDWTGVRFTTTSGPEWQGVEVRMTSRSGAQFELTLDGYPPAVTRIGRKDAWGDFPLRLSPHEAFVHRKDTHSLFNDADAQCVIFWLEPGCEPAAFQKKQAELRKQLKAIGYIE